MNKDKLIKIAISNCFFAGHDVPLGVSPLVTCFPKIEGGEEDISCVASNPNTHCPEGLETGKNMIQAIRIGAFRKL